jgi:hypothetical protein
VDDDFEPQALWHALTQGTEPPNFYELLGLPVFTDDPAQITDACQRRFASLHRYEGGKYQERTQQLIEAVSEAYHCLTHAARKRDYDEQLRSRLATQVTQVDVPAGAETNTDLPAPPVQRPVLPDVPCEPPPVCVVAWPPPWSCGPRTRPAASTA